MYVGSRARPGNAGPCNGGFMRFTKAEKALAQALLLVDPGGAGGWVDVYSYERGAAQNLADRGAIEYNGDNLARITNLDLTIEIATS